MESSFINQHILTDIVTKLSILDSLLIYTSTFIIVPETLYLNFINDSFFQVLILFVPVSLLCSFEYQDTLSTVFLISPELYSLFNDYILFFFFNPTYSTQVISIFDTYTNNLNYFIGEGIFQFFFFLIYV
jgi:hypothetical protein